MVKKELEQSNNNKDIILEIINKQRSITPN